MKEKVKDKIIWYLCYLVIVIWVLMSLHSIKSEVISAMEASLNKQQEESAIYIDMLNDVIIHQKSISWQIYDINQRLNQWESE